MQQKTIVEQLKDAALVLDTFINDQKSIRDIERAAQVFSECISQGGKVISCGNGGSHCDAMHFAEELTGRFRGDRPSYAAIAVSDPSHITCVGNDYGFDYIFSRFVEGMGREGDALLAISTSGNSKNVLNAAEVAKKKGIKVVALTGKDGGKLASVADVEVRAPHFGYADRIQEIHIKVIHIIIQLVEENLKQNVG